MATPFDRAARSIGVTIVTSGSVPPHAADAAVVTLEPALHDHPQGDECVACAACADVRAILFDLLSESRNGARAPLSSVIIDASSLADPLPVIDRLAPNSPAVGMRDHTVARSFHLAGVI